MTAVVACPSCGRKLRVPEDLLGQEVQCPMCSVTFTAEAGLFATLPEPAAHPPEEPPGPAVPEPAAASGGQPPQLSLDEEGMDRTPLRGVPPPPPPLRVVPLSGSAEPPESARSSDYRRCPACGERIRREAHRCRFCGRDIDTAEQRGVLRRDCEPHRAGLVLALGIVSLVMTVACPVIGLPCGITAWSMGTSDLAQMDAQTMDPDGRGTTNAGRLCGIFGTILGGLLLLAWCGLLGLSIMEDF